MTYFSITYILLITHIILQLSYNLTSHNFGLSILDYGYFQSVFITCLNTIVLLSLVNVYFIKRLEIFKSSIHILNPFLQKNLFLKKKLYVITLTSVLIYIYLISFNNIINNLFWVIFSEDILNNWFWWCRPYILIPLISYLNFHYITVYSIIFILVLNNNLLVKWVLNIFNLKSKTVTNLLHLLLIIAFVYPSFLLNSIFIFWDLHLQNTVTYNFKKIRSNFNNIFFLENLYTYNIFLYLQTNNSVVTLTTPLWVNFNTNFQFFDMTVSDQILEQSIFSSVFNYIFQVNISDLSTFVVDQIYIIFLIKTLFLHTNKNIIIF
jgi:hypothetical protein